MSAKATRRDTMLTIPEEAIWTVGAAAREAAQSKPEWVTTVANTAAALAVAAVADLAIEKLTDEDRKLLTRSAAEKAAERISDLVADIAEDLADDYLWCVPTGPRLEADA